MKTREKRIHNIFGNSPFKKALFRVDAGRRTGLSFGHAARCSILANCLKKKFNTESIFLMHDYPEGIKYIQDQGLVVEKIKNGDNNNSETEAIFNVIKRFKPDWFISDLPYTNQNISYFTNILELKIKLLFIDDSRFISPKADIILNSSILAEKNTPIDGDAKYLLGPKYFIFAPGYDASISPFKSSNNNQIVISFGGSDPADLTVNVVKALAKRAWNNASFNIILGPGFKDHDTIKDMADSCQNNMKIISNPENIYPFFKNADLVVCAGGRTLYELYLMGIPTFAVSSIAHEQPVIAEFLKQKLIIDGMLEWDSRIFENKITQHLNVFTNGTTIAY